MAVEYRIISIGAMAQNRLWGEGAPVRTSHATTTLVEDEKRLILVDPSLPATALAARFNERTGKTLQDVTDVFCTTLRPVHRRSVEAMSHATWWCNELEIQTYTAYLEGLLDSAGRVNQEDAAAIEAERAQVSRFKAAPEKFSAQVHLYPLVGASAGSAGLLLTPATTTVVIAGDAAVTAEHVLLGQVWDGCQDVTAAMESFEDMLEMADVIVPGHDNVLFVPRRWL
jgi:glyoxylase-like metal-dependent hydrolase (beta-lactamase superfamily II)